MQAFGVGAFLAGARLHAWPAGRKTRAPIIPHGDLIRLHVTPPYIGNNRPACRTGTQECHSICVYSPPCMLAAYSSLNLNVGSLNKSGSIMKLTMDYAMVRKCLCNVVYST
jgi:hypothetical protein